MRLCIIVVLESPSLREVYEDKGIYSMDLRYVATTIFLYWMLRDATQFLMGKCGNDKAKRLLNFFEEYENLSKWFDRFLYLIFAGIALYYVFAD